MSLQYKQATVKPDTRICEICGKEGLTGYMYSIMASWVVTGHAYVGAFSCDQAIPGNQHWGCTPEHAMEALMECLQHDAHLSVNRLKSRHQEESSKGYPRHAVEDEELAQSMPNFPFVKS